jgi:hypothetical protein
VAVYQVGRYIKVIVIGWFMFGILKDSLGNYELTLRAKELEGPLI